MLNRQNSLFISKTYRKTHVHIQKYTHAHKQISVHTLERTSHLLILNVTHTPPASGKQ